MLKQIVIAVLMGLAGCSGTMTDGGAGAGAGEQGPALMPLVHKLPPPPPVACEADTDCIAPPGPLGTCFVPRCDPTGAHGTLTGQLFGCYVIDADAGTPCVTSSGCAGTCAGPTGGGCLVIKPVPVSCGGCATDADCGPGGFCTYDGTCA